MIGSGAPWRARSRHVSEASRTRILLVEDEAIIAMSEQMVLERAGYAVTVAYSGEEAIEAFRQNAEIDLVLMDIDLGKGMDGTIAAQAILGDGEVPVVFLSSHTEPEIVDQTEKITSYGYIVKSSGETVLLASIRMAFRLFEARVSERLALMQLTHSTDLMRYIVRHARSAIAVHDRNLNYLYVSDEYLRTYEVESPKVIGRHHYEVFPDLPQKWRDVHQRSLEGEVLSADDDVYHRADGQTLWTRWECRPWYENDGTIGGIVINTEVTSRTERLNRILADNRTFLRTLLDTTFDGFCVVDSNARILEVNRRYCEMTGYDENQLTAMSIWDVDARDDRADVHTRMERLRDSGGEVFSSALRRKDGSLVDVDVSVSVLGEEPTSYIAHFRRKAKVSDRGA